MEKAAVSRRNHINKGNKENAQPTHGSKPIIRRDKTTAAPFHLKRNNKEASKKTSEEAKTKQADARSTSGVALKKVKTVEKNENEGAACNVARRQTHSQVFHAEQAVKHRKLAAEAPKPPITVQPPKSAPGMYKGKIVQSKIGSIWKSSASVDRADPKLSAPSKKTHMVGKVTKSKPVVDLSRCSTKKPAPTVSKSLLSRPAQVSKRVVTSRPLPGSYSARPPVRTVPATITSTSSRNPTVAATKKSGTLHSKPDKKVSKPPVSSSLSQYRLTMETAEERRAKLAEWLASKGKTFKRPAMTTAERPVTKVSEPAGHFQSQSQDEPHSAAQCKPAPEPSLEFCEPESAAADCADTQRAAVMQCNPTPAIINTTLELLDNSDLSDDPQDRVDDIVVNLCDALEAMATPSRCSDEGSQVSDESNGVETDDCKPKEECLKEEMKNKAEESDKHKVQTDEDDAEEEESDDDDDDVTESMTVMGDASVVKYSVKTTPYLQRVKKTIENEATSSTSKRKSNIKDLKFLTPVRRSTRIHRKSSHLPGMLVDHDPCVSSLAELVKLDDANAYIYRKNPALLEDLPDEPSL